MADLIFYAHYIASKVGKTGLTPTIDVHRITRATGATVEIVTADAMTEVGDGAYLYRTGSADLTTFDYVAIAKTTDATVDQQHLACMWTLWSLSAWDVASSALSVLGSIGKLITDYLDTTVSSRSTLTQAQILSDATPFAGANIATILTNINTALARIGAFTGTGVNTILGFLKAMASKAATLPSDIGGTYSVTTDSLEALSDKLTAAAPLIPSVSSGEITQYRGDAWSIAITGLGVLTGYTTIDFTIKREEKDADTAAVLRVRKNASGLSDGLMRVNGAAPTASTDASITIDDAVAGDITVAVLASVTDDLSGTGLFYDVQKIVTTTPTTMRKSVFNISSDVTRAIV